MPRIYDSQSNPLDFCRKCFPHTEEEAREIYGNLGMGPDDRGNCFGYDDPHPDYDDTDYRCEVCNGKLSGKRDE